MQPLRLVFKGINSYQDRVEVDLARLSSSGIFGVFGPVGSGKSTILDAMLLALYNETSKFGRNQIAAVFNPHCKEMYAEFEFLAGPGNEEHYRFTAKWKKIGKKESIKPEHSRYRNIAGSWEPLKEKQGAEEILGLTAEHFTKTVSIPQNKFNSFLSQKPADRSQTLKDLFNLGRFDVQAKVSQLSTFFKEKLAGLKGELGTFEEADEEKLAQVQKQRKDCEAAALKIEGEAKKNAEALKRHEQLKQWKAEAEQAEAFLQEAEARHVHLPQQKQMLEQFYKLELHLKHPLQHLRQSEEELVRHQADLQNTQMGLADSAALLAQKQQELAAEMPVWEQREARKQKAQALKAFAEVRKMEGELQLLEQGLAKAKELEAHAKAQADTLQKKIEENAAQQEEHKKLTPDRNQLGAAQRLAALWTSVRKQQQQAQQTLDELAAKHQKYLARLVEITPDDLVPLAQTLQWERLLKALETKKAQAERQLEKARQNADYGQLISELRANLKPGEPCMVCGSHEHHLDNVVHEAADLAQFRKTAEEWATPHRKAEKARTEFDNLKEQTEAAEKNSKASNEELESLATQWQQAGLAGEMPDEAAAKSLEEAENQWRQKATQLQDEYGRLRKQLDEQNAALTKSREQLVSNEGKAGELKGSKAYFAEKTKGFDHTPWQALSYEEQVQQANAEEAGVDRNIQAVERLKAEEAELNTKVAVLTKEASVLENNVKAAIARKEANEAAVAKGLKQAGLEEMAIAESLLARADEIPNLKASIEKAEQKISVARQKRQHAQERYTDSEMHDAAAHLEAIAAKESFDRQRRELLDSIGSLKQQEKAMQESLEAKKRLQKKLEAVQAQYDDIEHVSTTLRGQALMHYLEAHFFEQVVAQANQRFMDMNKGQLRLHFDFEGDKANVQVQDVLNNNNIRKIDTLSGGQMFQASLSMALALSENIQARNGSHQSFFFIDEGFGSLDRQSLREVMETLRLLAKNGKTVGVISHVEEMKDEIDVYLKVDRHPERGSFLHTSYE